MGASGALLAYQSEQGGAAEGYTDYFYVRDGLGSVVGLVQQNGEVAADYDYSPYGEVVSVSGKSIGGANRFRYVGGYQDKWSQLVEFGHRYYGAGDGRWTQRDPLNQRLDPVNANRYAYAACNPTTYTDPTGKITTGCAVALSALFISGAGLALSLGGIVAATAVTASLAAGAGISAGSFLGSTLGLYLACPTLF